MAWLNKPLGSRIITTISYYTTQKMGCVKPKNSSYKLFSRDKI